MMFKKFRVYSVLSIIVLVSALLSIQDSHATPTMTLIVNPNVSEVFVDLHKRIGLAVQVGGGNITYKWELRGPGKLEGDTTSTVVYYAPPQLINEESVEATITITITDDRGQQAVKSRTFAVFSEQPPPPSPTPSLIVGTVKITSLKEGNPIMPSTKISGTYEKNIQEDIWVFVQPEKLNNKVWPQSDDAATGMPASKNDGEWSVTCHFAGGPQNYTLIVYTATSQASEFLKALLMGWYNKWRDSYPGLLVDYLPHGLVQQDKITVKKIF